MGKTIKGKELGNAFIRGQMVLMKRDTLIALVSREVCMAKQSQRWEKNRERKSWMEKTDKLKFDCIAGCVQ